MSINKGRGLVHFEQYAALARVGRKRGLTNPQRLAVWKLRSAHFANQREFHVHDFANVILLAEKSLPQTPLVG